MNLLPWILLALLIIEHTIFLPSLFKRAGQVAWHGVVPGLNYWTWLKVIGRPWYWIFMLLVPGINLAMLVIMQIELSIVFNKRTRVDQWKIGALPWLFLPALAKSDQSHVGPRDWSKKKKSVGRDWGESILWALIVASVVRAFFFEAFTIPTASMEGSMLVGDYLYVSKTSYGAKIPQTPVAVPLIHNALPGTLIPSYTSWFSLPYKRLPGWRDVERYDAVVFNFPHGDSIVVDPLLVGHDYYGIMRREAIAQCQGDLDLFESDREAYLKLASESMAKKHGIASRPLDKSENYVKRCVALPGETLEVIRGSIHINGEALVPPAGVQFEYRAVFNSQLDARRAFKGLGLTNVDLGSARMEGDQIEVILALTDSERMLLENGSLSQSLERMDVSGRRGSMEMFPNVRSTEFNQWDPDNVGPILLPNVGLTVELNQRNLDLYRRVIDVYEGHDLEEVNGIVRIDGVETTSYTFELDYYWMMGDNRHRSADSRMWGFVPSTHVVGRASFIWFSKQNEKQHGESKIRWDRMFKSVK
jgi:signal peptidase I